MMQPQMKIIEDGLTDLYNNRPLSSSRQKEMGTAITEFCKYNIRPVGGEGFISDDLEFRGFKELYEWVNKFLSTYLKSKQNEMSKEITTDNIVNVYIDNFTAFKVTSRKVNVLFHFLNTYWIRRSRASGCDWIRPIYQQCLIHWKEQILNFFNHQLIANILSQIERERLGNSADPEIIEKVINLYNEKNDDFEPFSQIYMREFEPRYIENAKEFYAAESAEFLKSHTVTEYLTLAERRLTEECTRAQSYFHPSTLQPLKAACQDVLILGHMELLKLEFAKMVLECQHENVARMLRILSDHPDQYAEMCQILKNVVETEGRNILEQNKEIALKDVNVYFSLIYNVIEKFRSLVEEATINEVRIFKASEQAYRSLIKTNPITLTHKNADINAGLLARYADRLLKKNVKVEEDIEVGVEKIVNILGHLESRDAFIVHYRTLMAERVLLNNTLGYDMETKMLSGVKRKIEPSLTSRLERMLTDCQVSNDFKKTFNQFIEKEDPSFKVKLEVSHLTAGIWPLREEISFTLPLVIEKCISMFQKFYSGLHNHRKLTWMHRVSRAEIQTSCYGKNYSLSASTYQMAILLNYNDALSFSVDQLQQRTGINMEYLLMILETLLKTNVLVCEGDMSPSSNVSLNQNFNHKKLRANINISLAKLEKAREKPVQKEIDLGRKYEVEAAITRILKGKKQLGLQELIAEVISALSSRFKVDIQLIKTCVKNLIAREYLERDKKKDDVIKYLA